MAVAISVFPVRTHLGRDNAGMLMLDSGIVSQILPEQDLSFRCKGFLGTEIHTNYISKSIK